MKTTCQTYNPFTEEIIESYDLLSEDELNQKIDNATAAFRLWGDTRVSERINFLTPVSSALEKNADTFAHLIVREMGKTFREAKAEIIKCAFLVREYAERGELWMRDEVVDADGVGHNVVCEPLGIILQVMPWNFPFWQVFRFAIPAILGGNVIILKHSNRVAGCSLAIEWMLKEIFPKGVFQSVICEHYLVEKLLANPNICGLAFTGSSATGAILASIAGKNLKKSILELGGSDPFLVLPDVEIEPVVKNAVFGRLINAGQSCIASKRFIVAKEIAAPFTRLLTMAMESRKMGDPMLFDTDLGPLISRDAQNQMQELVDDAVEKGAVLLCGGKIPEGKGCFYPPTVLGNVTPQMRVFSEEVFGPIAPVIVAENIEEMIALSNNSQYGLAASVWTPDLEKANTIAKKLKCGSVFINSIVKSDPRMPFGGIKNSGYGRELSRYGLREFVNIKGYNVYKF